MIILNVMKMIFSIDFFFTIQYHNDAYLGWESTEETIPEMAQGERKILVEEIFEELAHAQVGPATMYE